MAENSEISWTDHTFNPWIGCTKVGPGCDNCYAEARLDKRFHRVKWGSGQERIRTNTWGDPRAWNGRHDKFFAEHGRRQRVFCASLADVFDNEVPVEWRADLLMLIRATPNLDWLLLTKRIGNVTRMLQEVAELLKAQDRLDGWDWLNDWISGSPPHNVWLGATIVNGEELLRDGPKLKAVPAHVRFWSSEPLLGDLGEIPPALLPDWVIVGGESGPGARPMHPDWARSLRDQCAAADVPLHFKQWGEWLPVENDDGELYPDGHGGDEISGRYKATVLDGQDLARVGKKKSGRLLDGVEHNSFPEA